MNTEDQIRDIWNKLNDTRDVVIRVETRMGSVEDKIGCLDEKVSKINKKIFNSSINNAVTKFKVGIGEWIFRISTLALITALITKLVNLW